MNAEINKLRNMIETENDSHLISETLSMIIKEIIPILFAKPLGNIVTRMSSLFKKS